jgi:hypothetical protein
VLAGGKVADAELPGRSLAVRDVQDRLPVGAHLRPGHLGALVEEDARSPVIDVLGVELVRRVPVRREVEVLPIRRELSEELVGDADGEALGTPETVSLVVLGASTGGDGAESASQESRRKR